MSLDIDLEVNGTNVFWANITHNLGEMANKAGIYQVLWRAPENGITEASQLIKPLQKAVKAMKTKPEYFKRFNPENGWGDYDGFLTWLETLLEKCIEYPSALVDTSR